MTRYRHPAIHEGLRELLAAEATSYDASKPICHFCRSLEACLGLQPNCAVLNVMSRWASRGEGVCSC